MIGGVDGCKGGWVVALGDGWPPRPTPRLILCPAFADVVALTRGCTAVVVDMPIGLPSARDWPRACDLAAKALLAEINAAQTHRVPGASSRVFLTPPRETLSANTPPEFQQRHHQFCQGKGAGLPVWGILPKLREVDATMTRKPELQRWVREFHPELAWMRLAGEVLPSKHKPDGLAARRKLLARHVPGLDDLLARRREIGPGVAEDDVLDALIGLHVADGLTQTPLTARRLPRCVIPIDKNSLRAEIWY
jgi:predicted RNase H-like nuclease